MPKVTLCSYTFNDATLLHGLLLSVSQWTLRPDEIVIIDDCSKETFNFDQKDIATPIRIYRNEINRGAAYSKSFGISQATSDYILSLDCDMRIENDWLEKSIDILSNNNNIGIIGAHIESGAAESLSSRYDNITSSYRYSEENPTFLNGSIWLFSRNMWSSVDGFDEYEERTHEDHYFCKKVISSGYKLCVPSQLCSARQVRKLHYTDLIRRLWTWKKSDYTNFSEISHIRAFFIVNIQHHVQRINYFVNTNQPELCYIELVLFLTIALKVLEAAKASPSTISDLHDSYACIILFINSIQIKYKTIFNLLILDLKSLLGRGIVRLIADIDSAGNIHNSNYFLDDIFAVSLYEAWDDDILVKIEDNSGIILDDRLIDVDFTFYRTIT